MSDGRKDPRNTFSRNADRYLHSSDHQSGPDLETIRQIASRQSPAVTVDVATGAGHALRAASPFSGFCIALDLSMEMLQVAKEHLTGAELENVSFVQSSADQLPFADGVVSLLTCRIAPHHFSLISGFLSEVARVLEPNGRCVIIDNISPEEIESDLFLNEVERLRDPSHIRSHTLRQWLHYFEKTDLMTISVELFERNHPFQEWAARTGLDKDGIKVLEQRFLEASPGIREQFKVQTDDEGKVTSYTDEKGMREINQQYQTDGFEVEQVEEEGKYFLFTRRVVEEVVVEGSPI